jgi:HEPN domain-containing protein
MKTTTGEWLKAAEDDLLAARMLLGEDRLTNLAAFHCQQCIEKCFKSLLEEFDKPFLKSHDLFRLNEMAAVQFSEEEIVLLGIINEVYIDSRYPGDAGLLPDGKPTNSEISHFVDFCDSVFHRVTLTLS